MDTRCYLTFFFFFLWKVNCKNFTCGNSSEIFIPWWKPRRFSCVNVAIVTNWSSGRLIWFMRNEVVTFTWTFSQTLPENVFFFIWWTSIINLSRLGSLQRYLARSAFFSTIFFLLWIWISLQWQTFLPELFPKTRALSWFMDFFLQGRFFSLKHRWITYEF